jgi:DNA topoisomerase-1
VDDGAVVEATLSHLNGEKLDKMSIADEQAAKQAVAAIEDRDFLVSQVEKKKARRHPAAPFTTSTLQQEASRKLRMPIKRTMQVAQKLYEGVNIGGETVGLITYMRTDGVQISNAAINGCRSLIGRDFGANYVPDAPRVYKTKAKNRKSCRR